LLAEYVATKVSSIGHVRGSLNAQPPSDVKDRGSNNLKKTVVKLKSESCEACLEDRMEFMYKHMYNFTEHMNSDVEVEVLLEGLPTQVIISQSNCGSVWLRHYHNRCRNPKVGV